MDGGLRLVSRMSLEWAMVSQACRDAVLMVPSGQDGDRSSQLPI